jgi:branched-chain amino acid transport system ATP-binding protein
MLLELRNVTVEYGRLKAARDVSLEMDEGSIVTLLGVNGAGKTTLFKTISGLIRPSMGSIWFRDTRIDKKSPEDILRLGIAQVPEGRHLFPHMTVLENLNLGAYSRNDKVGIQKSRQSILETFPVIEEKGGVKAGTLSGGQQQLLAIARALMAEPKLLLLDEPAQGLAPLVIKEIEHRIKSINERGITVGLIEHNVRLALGLSQKVYIIYNGEMVFTGSPSDLTKDGYAQKIYLGA